MTDVQASGRSITRPGKPESVTARRAPSPIPLWIALAVVAANVGLLVWLWWDGGNVTHVHSTGDFLVSIARITGLLGAFSALLQVLLLARIPWIERSVGFDRLTVWHRWNGHACLYLVLAHVVFSVWGYAALDKLPLSKEISQMLTGGIYPGMITATIGTVLLIAVVVSSVVVVRRHVRYEAWYAIHLTVYASIALAWFHQIPTGNELVVDHVAADYWRGLYLATLALLLGYRVLVPLVNTFRYRLRVADVVDEGAGVVSLRIEGRRLDRLQAQAGQFFLWRFLNRDRWWASHPFSLSAAPDGRALRITIKDLGDFTHRAGAIRPGTRIVAEGPFGVFTDAMRRRDKVALIGGGIGITPIRSLLEEMDGDLVVVYRVVSEADVIFGAELQELATGRGAALHVVAGDHRSDEGRGLLSPAHLKELIPDIAEREVYVCGPPAMADAARKSVRKADVPSRYIHTERFAL
jgi:predicted ferric reductase